MGLGVARPGVLAHHEHEDRLVGHRLEPSGVDLRHLQGRVGAGRARGCDGAEPDEEQGGGEGDPPHRWAVVVVAASPTVLVARMSYPSIFHVPPSGRSTRSPARLTLTGAPLA